MMHVCLYIKRSTVSYPPSDKGAPPRRSYDVQYVTGFIPYILAWNCGTAAYTFPMCKGLLTTTKNNKKIKTVLHRIVLYTAW